MFKDLAAMSSPVTLPHVPADRDPEWDLYVDGEPVAAQHVLLELRRPNKPFRQIYFGQLGNEGNHYPGILYYEQDGGGTVVMPYVVRDNGEVLVDLARQHRQAMGPEPVLTAVGGYMKPNTQALENAQIEMGDEVGTSMLFGDVVPLPGKPSNPNRAFWVAVGDEGIKYNCVAVRTDALETEPEEDGSYRLRPEVVNAAPDVDKDPRNREQILSVHFIPLRDAMLLRCDLANVGAGRLAVHLNRI